MLTICLPKFNESSMIFIYIFFIFLISSQGPQTEIRHALRSKLVGHNHVYINLSQVPSGRLRKHFGKQGVGLFTSVLSDIEAG